MKQYDELFDRIASMTDEERKTLDPLAYLLESFYHDNPPRSTGHVVANRVAALAALDAFREWEAANWQDAWESE